MARLLWNFGLQLDNNVAKLRTVNQETLQQEAVVVHVSAIVVCVQVPFQKRKVIKTLSI